MFWWRDEIRGSRGQVVDLGFTDRDGGESTGAAGSLNLSLSVGDDAGVVARNRARVARSLGVTPDKLAFTRQVHGAQVRTVHRVGEPSECDAQVTDVPGVGLAVLVADCTPVIVVDVEAGVIATAHAGRPGMTSGVVDAMLDRVAALGARHPRAFVGPSVCPRCYEVPVQMREDAARVSPESRSVSWTGTPAIDVAAGVVAQLRARDVEVTWVPGCTREDERLFSHRRDPRSGRFAGVVAIRDPGAGDA